MNACWNRHSVGFTYFFKMKHRVPFFLVVRSFNVFGERVVWTLHRKAISKCRDLSIL